MVQLLTTVTKSYGGVFFGIAVFCVTALAVLGGLLTALAVKAPFVQNATWFVGTLCAGIVIVIVMCVMHARKLVAAENASLSKLHETNTYTMATCPEYYDRSHDTDECKPPDGMTMTSKVAEVTSNTFVSSGLNSRPTDMTASIKMAETEGPVKLTQSNLCGADRSKDPVWSEIESLCIDDANELFARQNLSGN